jgi:hypothetical protein
VSSRLTGYFDSDFCGLPEDAFLSLMVKSR